MSRDGLAGPVPQQCYKVFATAVIEQLVHQVNNQVRLSDALRAFDHESLATLFCQASLNPLYEFIYNSWAKENPFVLNSKSTLAKDHCTSIDPSCQMSLQSCTAPRTASPAMLWPVVYPSKLSG